MVMVENFEVLSDKLMQLKSLLWKVSTDVGN